MPVEFHHRQFDNGLTLIAETNPDAHTCAVGFFVSTGARDETADVMGVSHFLEHMMFKGTDRRTADDVNREFDEIGANYNAFTSHEETVYYAHVLPEFLPRAVDLLTDMLRPALREDDFTMEKNVILEEIGMYDDRPNWRLNDALMEKYFRGGSLGFRVLGTNDSIKALTAAQMRRYFEQRYASDNIIIAASGPIDFEPFADEIARLTSHWQPSGAVRAYAPQTPVTQDLTLRDPKLSRHYVSMMWPGPSAQDERRYAAKVLVDVLGDSSGSRLYWALVDPGVAEEADASFMPMDQAGAYHGFACCDPARAEEVEATLAKVIAGFGGELDDAEIERARNKIATAATLSGERPLGRMMALGGQWLYLGEYRSLEEELQHLMRVTRQDVLDLLDAYPFENATTMRLTPAPAPGS